MAASASSGAPPSQLTTSETARAGTRQRRLRTLLSSPHLLVAVFASVAATTLLRHEMWLDELNPWVIARDAHSLRDLFYNMRFEPHPPLWYLCLYALTRMTRNPAAMQLLHGAIATASVALLAYCSPFRLRDVWLLAFGYYFVFEYCAISRGYALGIFLALSACALASASRPRMIPIAALLALLANTSVFGVFLACALAIAMAPLARGRGAVRRAVGMGILIVGLGVSIRAVVPSPNNTFGRDRHTGFSTARVDQIGQLLGAAYVPLPDATSPSPWNSSALIAGGRRIARVGHFLPAMLGGALFLLTLVHCSRRPALAVAFATGTALIVGLLYLEYSGGYRHHGHVFILTILMLWLAGDPLRAGRAAPRWFAPILVIHLAAGAYFVALDINRPFSASKDVADFLSTRPRDIPIVVAQPQYFSYMGPPLSAYLQQRVYYAISHGVVRGSYLWYDDARVRGADEDEIAGEIGRFAADLATDVYVVSSHWDSARLGQRIAEFSQDTIEGDERATVVHLFKNRR